MVVGGMTQYLTKVQEMPERITKRLTDTIWDFIWEGKARSAPINRETMHATPLEGGKKILDLEARNKAIQLTWLQAYMTTSNRPTWAYFANSLLRLAAPISGRIIDQKAAVNPILQNWRPRTTGNTTLPKELTSMIRMAKKHGVRIDGIETGEEIRNTLPIWFHIGETAYMRQMTNRPAAKCLRTTHGVQTVEQTRALTIISAHHTDSVTCACKTCTTWRRDGCCNPVLCRDMSKKILAALPLEWQPGTERGDIDIILNNEEHLNNDNALPKGEDVTFEHHLTVTILEALRIFTTTARREYH
jgi:hypothetical protein